MTVLNITSNFVLCSFLYLGSFMGAWFDDSQVPIFLAIEII